MADDLDTLRLPELKQRFLEVIGEETRCPNRTFLIRRIREAQAAIAATATAVNGSAAAEPAAEEPGEDQPDTGADEREGEDAEDDDSGEPAVEDPEEAQLGEDAEAEAIDEPAAEEPAADQLAVVEPADEPEEDQTDDDDGEDDDGEEDGDADDADLEDDDDDEAVDEQPVEDELERALVDELTAEDLATDAEHELEPLASAPQPTAPRLVPLRRLTRQPQRSERGRFKSMTVEELQALYLQTVGRPTGSSNKSYLQWKVREAEKGRIPLGPRESRTANQQGSTDVRILPLRLEATAVEQMDAAWRAHGMKTRMEFFRRALGHYLEHIGAREAAALFAGGER